MRAMLRAKPERILCAADEFKAMNQKLRQIEDSLMSIRCELNRFTFSEKSMLRLVDLTRKVEEENDSLHRMGKMLEESGWLYAHCEDVITNEAECIDRWQPIHDGTIWIFDAEMVNYVQQILLGGDK